MIRIRGVSPDKTNCSDKLKTLAGEPGFELGLHGPEPCVLPLDDSPVTPQKVAGWTTNPEISVQPLDTLPDNPLQ